MVSLALIYHEGQGVTEDKVRALMWLEIAAAQNYGLAESIKDVFELDMSPAQIAEAKKLAREWKPKKGSLR